MAKDIGRDIRDKFSDKVHICCTSASSGCVETIEHDIAISAIVLAIHKIFVLEQIFIVPDIQIQITYAFLRHSAGNTNLYTRLSGYVDVP